MTTSRPSINASGEIDRRVGFKCPCPRCGVTGQVHINTADLFGDKAFYCVSCKREWSFNEMERSVMQWSYVLEWVNILRQREGNSDG